MSISVNDKGCSHATINEVRSNFMVTLIVFSCNATIRYNREAFLKQCSSVSFKEETEANCFFFLRLAVYSHDLRGKPLSIKKSLGSIKQHQCTL